MKLSVVKFTVITLALMLAGCAGTDFVRITDDSLILRQTTYDQIIARLGPPYREGLVTKNNQQMKAISYGFSSASGEAVAEGVTPARSQAFFFFNNKMVGYEFVSSWKADSSNFDGTKVSLIRKGESTRNDVIRLLGKPGGKYIYPIIPNNNEEAMNYLYAQTKGSAFSLKVYQKQLIVTFNQRGIVTNIEYTEAGQK